MPLGSCQTRHPMVAPADSEPAPLRSLPYVNGLLVGEFASSAGSAMALLGIAYLSYDDSGSVLHTVLVSAAYSLPMALFGMYAGRLSQRVSRRRILLTSYTCKIAIYLALAALAAAGSLKVPGLMISSVLAGVVAAFTSPAWMEYERDLLPADRIAEANGAFGSVAAAAGIAGALAGGALMGVIGVWSVFLVDALSYLPFLWVVARAKVAEQRVESTAHITLRATRDYLRANRPLWQAFGRIAMLSLLVAPVAQLLPAIAANVGRSQSTLGILTAVFGVGAMSVAWVIARLQKRFDSQRIIDLSFLATALVLCGFGLLGDPLDAPVLWVLIVAALIPLGLLLTLAQSVIAAIVQVRVDPEMEGPVFALYAIVYTVVAPIGGIALGLVADAQGVWVALSVAGVAMLILTLVLAVVLRTGHHDGSAPGAGPHHPARLRMHHLQSGVFPVAHEHRPRRA